MHTHATFQVGLHAACDPCDVGSKGPRCVAYKGTRRVGKLKVSEERAECESVCDRDSQRTRRARFTPHVT